MACKKYPIALDLIYVPGNHHLSDPPRVSPKSARETKKYYFVLDGQREIRFEKNDYPHKDPQEIAFHVNSSNWGNRSYYTIRMPNSSLAQEMRAKSELFYMANQSIQLLQETIRKDISNPVIAEVYKLLRDQGENHVN